MTEPYELPVPAGLDEERIAQMAEAEGLTKEEFKERLAAMQKEMEDPLFRFTSYMVTEAEILSRTFQQKMMRNAELPPHQRRLPDLAEMEKIFNIQAKVAEALRGLRDEQRKQAAEEMFRPLPSKSRFPMGFSSAKDNMSAAP
jgi:hypothetical protein